MGLNWQRSRRLSEYSTFGIGGPIHLFAEILTPDEMQEAFIEAKKWSLPVFILGKGSNCLFDDKGFEGIVLLNRIDFLEIEGTLARAGSGASFSLLGIKTARQGLTGLEFASGIPASVGGAVFMNAGANGKETKDSLKSVEYLFSNGEVKVFSKEELKFSYRRSPFQTMQGAILSASFCLEKGEGARRRQMEILAKRIETQPLKDKSAGCIFRNPREMGAGALIDACGLKGFSIGGAAVSETHANFLINRGGATAKDVLSLIEEVQKKVREKTGVFLEPEVRIVGPRG